MYHCRKLAVAAKFLFYKINKKIKQKKKAKNKNKKKLEELKK